MSKKPAWNGQYESFNEALKYMYQRQSGEEKSIYTPWPKFNDATTDGCLLYTSHSPRDHVRSRIPSSA